MSDRTPDPLSADDLTEINAIAAILTARGADLWYDVTDPGLTDDVRAALRRYAALEDGASPERLDALKNAYSNAAQALGG